LRGRTYWEKNVPLDAEKFSYKFTLKGKKTNFFLHVNTVASYLIIKIYKNRTYYFKIIQKLRAQIYFIELVSNYVSFQSNKVAGSLKVLLFFFSPRLKETLKIFIDVSHVTASFVEE
jgi:hypothetical protein